MKTKREDLLKLLEIHGTKRAVADILGVDESTVRRACRKYGITWDSSFNLATQADVDMQSVKKLLTPVKWKIPKTTKTKSKRKKFKSYLVVTDHHVPYQANDAVNCVLRIMDDYPFDGIINLGDFVDLAEISHWNKSKRLLTEGMRLKKDFMLANAILDEYDRRLPKGCDKRFLYGNHERFYYDLVEELPGLAGMFDPKVELHLEDRGYKVYDKINHIERIGRISFTHGMYTTVHATKKHLDSFKTNVIFGHLHTPEMRMETSPAREVAMFGGSVGAMCNLSPSFMKNRPHAWSHGFAVVHFFEDGNFDVELKRIVRGRVVFNGKVYGGK